MGFSCSLCLCKQPEFPVYSTSSRLYASSYEFGSEEHLCHWPPNCSIMISNRLQTKSYTRCLLLSGESSECVMRLYDRPQSMLERWVCTNCIICCGWFPQAQLGNHKECSPWLCKASILSFQVRVFNSGHMLNSAMVQGAGHITGVAGSDPSWDMAVKL